ncbi:MAG TPA: glycoside hydrolase family 43 protein [Candidatus Xenobia bacterium]|jgi:beta-xylosidase
MTPRDVLLLGLLMLTPASGSPTTYTNPVIAHDAPDPGVLRVDDTYYLVTTGDGPDGAFPLYTSRDLEHWKQMGSALPTRPTWAGGAWWAPELHQVGGRYLLYYSAETTAGQHVIGVAQSDQPQGPFQDVGKPLAADPHVGLIDATFFHDTDGKNYLYWKEDGNAIGQPCRIMAAPLSADGTQVEGSPVPVLENDPKSWEGTVVEGPELVKRGDWYYLFYSGNGYAGDAYGEGVARSQSPTGPFEKRGHPLLHSNAAWKGPGHADIVTDPAGENWLLYHAWPAGHVNAPPGRELLLDRLWWGPDDWPYVQDGAPSTTPQVGPVWRRTPRP